MSGSVFGKVFQVSTWGESHGEGLGVVVDGCPAGVPLSVEDIQHDMDLRKPGSNKFGTQRSEGDEIRIMSGVFQGKTTGTPISLMVFNKDQQSKDYSQIANTFRPSHADYTFHNKYGFRDYRGGGRSSGRETLSRVAAGAVAKKVLKELGVSFLTYSSSIGGIRINTFDEGEIKNNPLFMPDKETALKCEAFLQECMKNHDSAGGTIDCVIKGLPCGIGETVFDKLDANLAKAMFSIGAVKGFEIGNGFNASNSVGSQNNDPFTNEDGKIIKVTNNSGGILGGMSDGSPVTMRLAFKPTPSIFQTQQTVDTDGNPTQIEIKGRHDPIIVPRAVIVVEAMAAITVLDLMLQNTYSKIENIKAVYDLLEKN